MRAKADWAAAVSTVVTVLLASVVAGAAPCPPAPTACVEADSGQLRLVKRAAGAATLKWRATALDIAMGELERPESTASYSFCIYAGTSEALIMGIDVPPSPRWKAAHASYRYQDKARQVAGLQTISASTGSLNDATLMVKVKTDELLAMGFPFAEHAFPVLVQLTNHEQQVCWESTFEKGMFARNSVNRRGAKRSLANLNAERCRDNGGCAVERPLVGAALCRDRVAAGGGIAKRMKIKMGDIIRCRGREAAGSTDGGCDPGVCPADTPACASLDSNMQTAVTRAIGHYQTKLNLACSDISVAAVQEGSPGWGAPCGHVRTVAELMACIENNAWGEYGNLAGDALFGTSGEIESDLQRCRTQLGRQTQKYSSKFNIQLYTCRRAPIIRGRPCNDDPVAASQTSFDNYVAKVRNSCDDADIARLTFGPPCAGATTVAEITSCLGAYVRELGLQGVALSYPPQP